MAGHHAFFASFLPLLFQLVRVLVIEMCYIFLCNACISRCEHNGCAMFVFCLFPLTWQYNFVLDQLCNALYLADSIYFELQAFLQKDP